MRISVPAQTGPWPARALFAVSLCIFVFAALYNLTGCFPCETIDEYCKFRVARKFIRIFSGLDAGSDLFVWPVATDFREPFLMHNNYVGWPALYFAVGLMSVLGKTLGYFFVFRLAVVPFGVLALFSIRFVLRRWFDEWTAVLTVFFVGCNYSYIQAVRHGFYREEVFQVCGLWLGLALCLMAKKRKLWLYLGFFVFGLALWAKVMFAGYIIGLLAAVLALGRKRRDFVGAVFPSFKSVLVASLGFVCGAAPFLWFNLRYGFPTVRLIFSRLFHLSETLETDASWNNADVFGNLLRRMHDFYLYLSQEVLFGECDDLFKVVYVVLFVCALVWGCAVVFGRRGDSALRLRLRCLFVFYAVVLFLTCFVPVERQSGHILVLVPFAGILCALFLVRVTRVRGLLFVPVLVCGLWFSEQVGHFYSFSRNHNYDDRVYGLYKGEYNYLLAWLKSGNIKYFLCSDPLGSLLCIMGNERDMEIYDLVTGSGYSADMTARQISSKVSDTPVYWLFNCDDYGYYSRMKDAAERYGLKIRIVDIKTLKRDPGHNFALCLVSRTDEKDKKAPVLSL